MKKNCEYWKNFVNTGKINDYLHYIACTQEESMDEFIQIVNMPMRIKEISMQSIGIDKEGGFIAGINYRDGNGSFSNAGW